MRISSGSVALVTGASSGIGAAVAAALLARGCKVYGTSRSVAPGEAVEREGVIMLRLDIGSEQSVADCVKLLTAREGRIDLLVNNAGSGVCGAMEDMPMEDIAYQLDVGFFGPLRVCRAVIPVMRSCGSGRIVNIGSVAATITVPFQTAYSAAKSAVRALTEGLRAEVRPFGIEVCTVEPGDTKTGFTAVRRKPAPSEVYGRRIADSVARMEHDEQNGAPPSAVANTVVKAAFSRRMKPRRTVGLPYKAVDLLHRLLPESFTEKIVGMLYGG